MWRLQSASAVLQALSEHRASPPCSFSVPSDPADALHPQLWPAHRVLCGRDPTFFYLPALSPAEVDVLERIKDEPFSLSGKTFVEYVSSLTPGLAWKVRRRRAFLLLKRRAQRSSLSLLAVRAADALPYASQDLLTIVGSDTTSSPLASAVRNGLLVHAFFHLDLLVARPSDGGPSPLWHTFGTLAVPTFVHCSRAHPALGPDLWRLTNDVLRQVLVYAALPSAAADPALCITIEEYVTLEVLAQRRIVAAVERAQVAQTVKDVLVANSEAHLEVLRDKMAALRDDWT